MALADFFARLWGRDVDAPEDGEPTQQVSLDDLVPNRVRVSECAPRSDALIAGKVVSADGGHVGTASRFEAVVDDESGVMLHAVWLGQQNLPGVVPGAILRLRGTLQKVRGRTSMIDPAYTILERDHHD